MCVDTCVCHAVILTGFQIPTFYLPQDKIIITHSLLHVIAQLSTDEIIFFSFKLQPSNANRYVCKKLSVIFCERSKLHFVHSP